MSTSLTTATIIKYVKHSLGSPTIMVEIDDEAIESMIAQALGIYGTYKPVEKIGSVNVIAGTQQYSLTASQIGKGIIEHFRPDLLRGAITLDEFDVFKHHTHVPNLDPGDYYLERIWWKEVRASSGSDDDFIVNIDPTDGSATVYVNPIPSESYKLVYVYVVDPTLTEVPASDDDWMKDYVLAMCMEVLGRIRSKFRGVVGAESSLDMDGDELKAKGAEMRTTMEEYLSDRGQIVAPIRG
jgi:hypothetical protein